MHFKRYNLVIISSEWIGAASYYPQLTSEITRRILTTSTAQSVLTFFSTSNSIFIVSLLQHGLLSSLSFFSEDPTLPLHLIRIRSVCYCGMARHWKRGVAELLAIHLLFQEESLYIAFPLLVKYSILFQSLLLFWTAVICLVCIVLNRSIQIKIILRLKYRTSSVSEVMQLE